MKYYLAIDIGASSGRHIVGWKEDGRIITDEIYRFPNGASEENGHLVWDTETMLGHVKEGIARAAEKYSRIESLSIDTWGVDYMLMDGDKEILPCYCYRDSRTEKVTGMVHSIIPFSDLYRRTGIQFQPFNTVYQLYADKLEGRLENATDFLLMPEYLMYKLCGTKAHEYTDATTGGMINAGTGRYDRDIISALGFPDRLFGSLSLPGTVIGEYNGIKVILCATHDTASAVEGIPIEGNQPYISSGTWSLLGVKTAEPITGADSEAANYSNEGGVGYNRYQKNIMGMWLINELKRELCPELDFDTVTALAESSVFDGTVDANSSSFLAPVSMKSAFDKALKNKPSNAGDYFRCAYLSLALCYKQALDELERNTGAAYEKLYIVGGGARNVLLNRLTAETTGKEVIALPIEATALGNLKIQMEAET